MESQYNQGVEFCMLAKKADYYKRRLPEKLHQFIVELAPVKKAKK